MSVALVLHEAEAHMRAWCKFVAYCHASTTPDIWERQAHVICDQHLHTYQAWTNWADSLDPIWFSDQDSLIQFLLTWS